MSYENYENSAVLNYNMSAMNIGREEKKGSIMRSSQAMYKFFHLQIQILISTFAASKSLQTLTLDEISVQVWS